MNYIIIGETKFEIVKSPVQIFPSKGQWASWSEWKLRIKSTKLDNEMRLCDNECVMKLDSVFYDVTFFLTNVRTLSQLKDHKILQLSMRDFRKSKMKLEDSRNLIISELFD
jgi:hypothetical protein